MDRYLHHAFLPKTHTLSRLFIGLLLTVAARIKKQPVNFRGELNAKMILVSHFYWVVWEVLSTNLELCEALKVKIIKFTLLNVIH